MIYIYWQYLTLTKIDYFRKSIYLSICLVISLNASFCQSLSIQNKNVDNIYKLKKIDSLNINYINFPNNIDPLQQKINYKTLAGVSLVTLGAGFAVHTVQYNAWWKDQRSKFHFQDDWIYARWIDKIGHFYGTNLLAHFFSSGLEASNFSTEDSYIYGATLGFAFQLYTEILDGFGAKWGFSRGDVLFNFAGAAYFLSQYYVPYLKNFQPRFSYYPSESLRDGTHDGFIDDYTGQKYWIGLRMKEILPNSISDLWPSPLMISVGMGLDNWNGYGEGTNTIWLALDIDWETIPLHGKFWQFLKNTFNYFHFPMPGIRISPNMAAFLIVF
jgi:hypothetical protein